MKHALTVIAMLAMLSPLHADEFYLIDATGKTHGPFEFKQGENLSIAGQEYTISKVLTKEQKITEKMKSIIIPEIEFRQANINDVIFFLQESSVTFDTKTEQRRGVSTVLNLGPQEARLATTSDDPFVSDPFATTPDTGTHAAIPSITFSARYVSLYEAMNIICKICDLKWSIQDSVVMIEPVKKEKVQPPPARGK